MIYGNEYYIMRYLNEVDIDGQSQDDDNSEANNQDFTAPDPVDPAGRDDNSEANNDQPSDNPEANNPPPDDNPEAGGDDGGGAGEEDFTQDGDANVDMDAGGGGDAGGDMGGGGEEGGDTGDDGGEGGDTGSSGGGDEDKADDARGLENELFKDLTPAQLDVKHKELKNNFVELFDATTSVINRISEIPSNESYRKVISFINTQLSDLRDYITDYMDNIYSTKSYMENAINYNRFLATLNGIKSYIWRYQ